MTHYFISYSTVEASEFAGRLYDTLVSGYPYISAWLDKRSIKPQMDWEVAVEQGIADCIGFLYIMTNDSVHPKSPCRQELGLALNYKKPVIPIKLHPDITAPLRMQNRQHIDFSLNFEAGIAHLREHLTWLETLEGKVYVLDCRLLDVERELPRTSDASQKARLETEILRLNDEISKRKNIAANPDAARQRTIESIERNIERERIPKKTTPELGLKFINPPPGIAPDYFQNRHLETQQLGRWLGDPQTRLIMVVGRGGVGKTAMACRLLKALEFGRLPDDGDHLHVDGIVYLSAANAYRPDVQTLFTNLGKLLPYDTAQELDALYREVQASPNEKMLTLLSHFPSTKRVVVLMDNFEDMMDISSENARIIDPELDQVLRTLLQAPAHGLKVIITTRVAPSLMLKDIRPGTYHTLPLDKGLESPYAENILREMDSAGRLGLRDADESVLSQVRERTRGYPRALEALVAIMEADPDSRLDDILTSAQSALPEDLVKVMVGEAFNRLDRSSQQVMQALAIFRKPVPPVALDYILQSFQPGVDSASILARLASMYFVRKEAGRYYLHPVDRDYSLSKVPPGEDSDRFEAGDPNFTQVALRNLGAKYLSSIRKPRAEWRTLLDLQPQIDEIEMRCEGEAWDSAAEILDDICEDYLRQWGFYRIELELRQRLDGHLTDEWRQYLNQFALGFMNHSIGRSKEALSYLETALYLAQNQQKLREECRTVAVIGYCHTSLGQHEEALKYFEKCMAIAHEAATDFERAIYSVLGQTYQQLGRHTQALEALEQARALAHEAEDFTWESDALYNLGNYYYSLGQYLRAIEYLERSLNIYIKLQDYAGHHKVLDSLADCYYALGDTTRAIEFYEKRIDLARLIDDPSRESEALQGLAKCYGGLRQDDRAIITYQKALIVMKRTGIISNECAVLRSLAYYYSEIGRYIEASQTCNNAIQIAKHAQDSRQEALSLSCLAEIHLSEGRKHESIKIYEHALAIYHSINDKTQQASVLTDIGDCYAKLSQFEHTISYYEKALIVYREISNYRKESFCLSSLGFYSDSLGNIANAISYHQQGLVIDRKIDDRKNASITLSNLAYSLLEIGNLEQAKNYFLEALEITREVGDRVEECSRLLDLGYFHRIKGETSLAIECLQMSLAIAHQARLPSYESSGFRNIGICYLDQGDIDIALQMFEKSLIPLVGLSSKPKSTWLSYQALAIGQLLNGDTAGAYAAIEAAYNLNQPDAVGLFSLNFGIILLHKGDHSKAQNAFTSTIKITDSRLAYTPELHDDLNRRAIAGCGLVLCGQKEHLSESIDCFHKARQIVSLPGSLFANLRLLDALITLDKEGILRDARLAIVGN